MSIDRKPFRLRGDQVPDFPSDANWRDALRWLVMVMDHDDPQLSIAASMLCTVLSKGGMSQKQATWAQDILNRVLERFNEGRLDSQQPNRETSESRGSRPPDLRVVNPEGSA